METTELISKAKYQLFRGFPFFSYLVDNLTITEMKEIPTMGVDGKGNVYYNNDFIQKICPNNDIKTLIGVLTHEALHLVFEHPKRGKGRKEMVDNVTLWNIAGDIYINNIILLNKDANIPMELPAEGILPMNDEIEMWGTKIVNISQKTTEDIYDELKQAIKQQLQNQKQSGKGKGEGTPVSGFDEHMDWDKESSDSADGKESTGKECPCRESEKDWKKILADAQTMAQQRGNLPVGMEREINQLRKSKINWKHFLQKAIRSSIPQDYTWGKPNKKYIGEGVYLPSTYGESIKVLFSIDTSGSISKEDLTDSISEIIAISKCYSGIEFRFLTHDIDVYEDIAVYNGNTKKMLQTPISGGGGTSHKPLYEHIKKKGYNRQTKLLISFTDGYSDFPSRLPIPTIFCLTKNHISKKDLPKDSMAIIEM